MSEYVVKVNDNPSIEINGYNVRVPDLFEQREEIVRCRDCYFADEIEGGIWCDRFCCGREDVTPNGFCAWGARRDA